MNLAPTSLMLFATQSRNHALVIVRGPVESAGRSAHQVDGLRFSALDELTIACKLRA
jgi:hypothetical protein